MEVLVQAGGEKAASIIKMRSLQTTNERQK